MIGRHPNLDHLDHEMSEHIEAETEDNIARGMSEADARAAAIRKFGNIMQVKEAVREVWVPGWLDQLRQDARDAVRHVRRNPAFSFAIVVTLALGIGLTTAIYSVVNAVLIRPLAYTNPDRVVWLTARGVRSGGEMVNSIDFATWSQATSLERMVAYDYLDQTLSTSGDASRMRIVTVSEGFWQLAGAQAVLGALPTGNETQVLVLTHQAFRDQFGGDPQVIGRAVTLDGRQATIGAVLPDGFKPQLPTHSWGPPLEHVDAAAYRLMVVPAAPTVIDRTTSVRLLLALGELKPGVPVEQALAEIETLHKQSLQKLVRPGGVSTPIVVPLREKLVGPSRTALGILLAAAVCVLLITCANVANLLLSRSAARRKEIALRMSIGSGPLRVIRQLMAESMAYAIAGGIGGVLLASWLVDLVVGVIGPAVPRLTETTLDVRVMAVAMATAIGTAVLFGLGPAVALCFTNVQEVLKDAGRSVSASRRALLTGRAMVALQVALTVVLLAGAGLMLKSVWRMTTYPAGFNPQQILTMRMDFRGPQYREPARIRQYAAALLAKAQGLPGVSRAAITTARDSKTVVVKEGEDMPSQEDRAAREVPASSISADFGRVLGMSLVAGRWFEEVEALPPVLINESLARRIYPGTDPLGQRIRLPGVRETRLATIVGVVKDLKYAEIDADAQPEVFFHHADTPLFGLTVTLHVDGDPAAAVPTIRSALTSVDPTQSFYAIKTMEEALAESIAPRRFNLLLLGTFALVAFVLAVVGVYGVVAYAVAERTHEIGIRLALGAARARVVRMIVTQGMFWVSVGLIAGLAGAAAATQLVAGLLYGVEARDTATFVVVTSLLAAVAFIACTAPALKAAFVDPANALRAE